jgi:hypothetical protein
MSNALEEYRPVKLEYKVLGFYPTKNDFLFDKTLNYKIFEVVKTHYNRKSTLIVNFRSDSTNYSSSAALERDLCKLPNS